MDEDLTALKPSWDAKFLRRGRGCLQLRLFEDASKQAHDSVGYTRTNTTTRWSSLAVEERLG